MVGKRKPRKRPGEGPGISRERFARLLEPVLDELGLTRAAFAKRIGVHVTTPSRWLGSEQGYTGPAPDLKTRRLIEETLGLPRGYLSDDRGAVASLDLVGLGRRWRAQGTAKAEGVVSNGLGTDPAVLGALESLRNQLESICRQVDLTIHLLTGPRPPIRGGDPAADADLVRPAAAADRPGTRRPA
jgi:transcriptional regulator with XRE-family HTH domain